MIDTHTHLFAEDFDLDREECVNRCLENNVNNVIIVGFSKETNIKAQEFSKKYPFAYPTAGIHPEECKSDYKEYFDYLVDFVSKNKVYAIGECGLDYYWDQTYKEEQKELFRLQCELAIKLNLPIIIHSREAHQDTFDIVKSFGGKLKGVMHCYSGSAELAKEYVKLGIYISLGGPVTFKNAKAPKEVADIVPLDMLLIETDSPFLAPHPNRGKRNESSYVKLVCEKIAEIKGLSFDEVDLATAANAKRLFNLN